MANDTILQINIGATICIALPDLFGNGRQFLGSALRRQHTITRAVSLEKVLFLVTDNPGRQMLHPVFDLIVKLLL